MDDDDFDGPLRIWFHGTTQKAAASILREGLGAGSYVAVDLSDAVEFGGDCVFEVALPAAWCSEAGWQMTLTQRLLPSFIVRYYKFERNIVYENDDLRQRVCDSIPQDMQYCSCGREAFKR